MTAGWRHSTLFPESNRPSKGSTEGQILPLVMLDSEERNGSVGRGVFCPGSEVQRRAETGGIFALVFAFVFAFVFDSATFGLV